MVVVFFSSLLSSLLEIFFSHSGNTTVAQLCAQALGSTGTQPPWTNLGSLGFLGLADKAGFQHQAQGELDAYILNINLL